MIIIQYSKKTPLVRDWEEKLTELIVAFRMEKIDNLPENTLKENSNLVKGDHNIQKHIEDLEKLINEWRAPGCGK